MNHAAIATAASRAVFTLGGGHGFRQGWQLVGRTTAEHLERRVGAELMEMLFVYEDNALTAELPLGY